MQLDYRGGNKKSTDICFSTRAQTQIVAPAQKCFRGGPKHIERLRVTNWTAKDLVPKSWLALWGFLNTTSVWPPRKAPEGVWKRLLRLLAFRPQGWPVGSPEGNLWGPGLGDGIVLIEKRCESWLLRRRHPLGICGNLWCLSKNS